MKLNINSIVKVVEAGLNVVDALDRLNSSVFFSNFKRYNDERKNENLHSVKNKGLECKLYNLLKNSEENIQNYELKEEKKKVNPLQIAAMSFIPGYVYFKVANAAYNKIIEVKDKQEKHNVFNDLFQESGLQEKMQNDVYYRPSIVELNNFKEEYKLRANVELIQMLAQYHG